MELINHIDLEGFISHAVVDVYDTMLSMALAPVEEDGTPPATGERIVGSVSFAGTIMGNVSILVGLDFAREMTAAMLGLATEEIEAEEEIHDVIGEMSNMIGGDLKSRFCDAGLACSLSIPSITSGSDFKIEPTEWLRHERFAFRHNDRQVRVEVFVKPGA